MHKKSLRVIALILGLVMLMSAVPLTASAAIADWATNNVIFSGTSFGTNGYYNVISKKDYTLVPGAAVESEMVINNSAGNRRQVMHIIEVDPSNPDVSIVPGYYGIDTDLTDVNNWKVAGVTDVVKYYEDNLGYNVVGAMNTSLAYDSNAPIDFMVYNGVNLSQGSHHAQTFLAVIKDPQTGEISCELHNYADGIPENCWQAVSANFAFTVKDGVLVSGTEERTSAAAARSMIGIKEDGTLVLVMNDGRGANNSIGFNNYELGESMLALGCKWAVNCDGGGSSSFVTKRAGENETTMRCVPCDGAERPTINSILITSNVGPTGELNNVNIVGDYDYFAPGTSYTFSAEAIDTHGYAMDMPADAVWSLSDASFGTVEDGAFVSNGTLGAVDIQIVSGGNVVGSKTITVANPTTLTLSATSTTLPYSTESKPRMVTLPIVSTIGEAPVYVDNSVFDTVLTVPEAGTMDGLTFIATTDESVAGTAINVTYTPTQQVLTYTVSFGKGSDILWDFEDGDISNWYGGSNDVKEWLTENGVAEADQLKTLISGGQISFSEQSHTFLSTRENGGQVHNGENALGVTFDFRNVEFNSWVYALLYNIQDQYVLRDVANGKKATTLGMWCYVPEGFCNPAGDTSGALAMQLTVYKNPQGTSGTQLNFQFYSENQKKRVSLNQCTEADIPENRWVYLTADLTGSDYYSLTNPLGTTYREPSFFRMYIKPTRAQELTYYFDDFTLDYSSAVDDRDAPVITNPTYCTNDENIAFAGQTINTNTVSFDANIADYAASNAEGLNYSTAAIYADGVSLSGVTASGNTMGVKNVKLSDGTHTIKFEIYDNAGNFSSISREITVEADASKAVVTLSGHNDTNEAPESDSIYYADLVASDISQIDSITTTLQLNTANTWELDHMIPAKGFTADYEYNEISKLATITVSRFEKTAQTGQQTLVSIPVRVWSFDESTDVGGDGTASVHMTKTERFNSSYGEPKVFVDVKVISGSIAYTDNTVGYFGGKISVATKLTGNKSNGMWHSHDAELQTLYKAPTCDEDGYENRTYCATCGSVIDWGTTLPMFGHSYELFDGQFICSECGNVLDLSDTTGVVQVQGKYYGVIAGNIVTGWQNFDDEWYYFHPKTFTAVKTLSNGHVTFSFEADGKLVSGKWYNDGVGTKYYYGPGYYKCVAGNSYANANWVEIDGATYAFDRQGYRHEGNRVIISSNDHAKLCAFDMDGKFIEDIETADSGFFYGNGIIAYLEDGIPVQKGLVLHEGDYYYFSSTFTAVMDASYKCTNMNGLMPAGTYSFDAEGKMINPPEIHRGPYDGYFYYNDGTRAEPYTGMVEYEGNFYYVSSGAKIVTNEQTRFVNKTNGLLGEGIESGYFDIDENGVMTPVNGPVGDYFYVDGQRVPAYEGLVTFEGNFYYVSTGAKIVKDVQQRFINKTNGLTFADGTAIENGYYDFDENGVMSVVNGPAGDYFYIDSQRAEPFYGLAEYNGNYYYISTGGTIVKNVNTRYINKTNGLLGDVESGYYDFDENGVMHVINGPVGDYFYIDSQRAEPFYGLAEYDGNFYYISTGGTIVKDIEARYINKTNGLTFADGTPVQNGYFNIDENGVMTALEGPVGEYFYDHGVKAEPYTGLVEYDGNFYYVTTGGKYVKDIRNRLMNKANGLTFADGTPIPTGYYDFDADGKMVVFTGTKDGCVYINGVKVPAYEGLVRAGDDYYYVTANADYVYGVEGRYINKTNDLVADNGVALKNGNYTFNADGTMVVPDETRDGFVHEFGKIYYYVDGELQVNAGLIVVDEAYYCVGTDGALLTGRQTANKTYGFLKPGNYNFDQNGKMILDENWVVGIRNTRDIAIINSTSTDVQVKSGMVIRGTEIDGWQNSNVTPADSDYAANKLANVYGIKTQIDLRSADQVYRPDETERTEIPGLADHKYYDMVYYDDVFTAAGKQKVKAIFTELAKPENYPVYVNCSFGLDRTGTVCYILEGLLGFSKWNLSHEYCFSNGSVEKSALKIYDGIDANYEGATFAEKTANYLKDCGITDAQIASIREILLVD